MAEEEEDFYAYVQIKEFLFKLVCGQIILANHPFFSFLSQILKKKPKQKKNPNTKWRRSNNQLTNPPNH